MNKLYYLAIIAIVAAVLGGCGKFDLGSSAPPPTDLTATAGDGRVKLVWTATPGVDYWIFSATDPALTAFNWTGLPNAKAVVNVPSPTYMCGLVDYVNSVPGGVPLTYYFAANARINGGPGGPSSSTISATPYDANTKSWIPISISTSTTPDIYGMGYTSLTTCANNTALSATGTFAAVGQNGAIFTSSDGISWTGQSSPITTTNLNAVAGYVATQNAALNNQLPGLRWVAVGDGGKAVYSTDGITWTAATATTTTQKLRSITQVGGSFYAVGDAGTIVSSSDGNSWSTPQTITPTVSYNLNGIAHAGIFVAVGDHGTIVVNGGGGWSSLPYSAPPASGPQPVSTSPTTQNLHQVAGIATAYGSIYVAVGDAGTIVTSDSYLHNNSWNLVTLPGTPNLVGVTVEPRGVETPTAYTTAPAVDPWLGFISAAQFVAMDSAGNTYTSINGHDWTATGFMTGTTCTAGSTCMNPLISSGFGYVAGGTGGTTAYNF